MAKKGKNKTREQRREKQESMGRQGKENLYERESLPPIKPLTTPQRDLLRSFVDFDLIVAEGSAGTGKTFTTAGTAADKLKACEIDKIVVSRPYVGMGNQLGFRPGTEADKMMPFLMPIFDVFKKRLGQGCLDTQMKHGNIEIAPVETLRGRSFEDAFVIVDEAQDTTVDEMKSIVTRMGDNSKLILMGDPKQKDIVGLSGLEWVVDMIDKYDVDGATYVKFSIDDCVRNDITYQFLKIIDREGDKQ